MHRSLKFRKRNLRAYVKEIKGRLEFVTEFEGTTIADVRKHLEDIVESRGEGLVLKHPNSQYVLGGRESTSLSGREESLLRGLRSSRRISVQRGRSLWIVMCGSSTCSTESCLT